jgi:hypothetical protein
MSASLERYGTRASDVRSDSRPVHDAPTSIPSSPTSVVIPGLVPGRHPLPPSSTLHRHPRGLSRGSTSCRRCCSKTWMAGTRPAMTGGRRQGAKDVEPGDRNRLERVFRSHQNASRSRAFRAAIKRRGSRTRPDRRGRCSGHSSSSRKAPAPPDRTRLRRNRASDG